MPNGDPQVVFSYPGLTFIIDYYNILNMKKIDLVNKEKAYQMVI